jgi:RHS repeat-associated protein
MLRERQTQTLSPEAGKVIVADTGYDERGLVQFTNLPEAVPGTAGAGLLPAPATGWANRNQIAYDEFSRPVWELFFAGSTAERSTVTAYTHESAEVTPIVGGKIRTTVDAYDRTVRKEEHDGAAYRATAYGFDAADRLTSIVDPAGNRIAYGYDLAGRRTSMADPDAGAWSYGYDAKGNQTTVTDPDAVRTVTAYDVLDRPAERRQGSASGTVLARWAYDAEGELGLLNSSTRVTPTGSWTVDVAGYDGRQRPTGRTWTVPSGVPGLSGSYPVGYGYDAADHVRTISYPAVGGLPAETVTTTYGPTGQPETMAGAAEYVHVAAFDDRARPSLFGFGPAGAPALGKLWQYNASQQLSRLVASAGQTGVQDLRIGYDRAANVVERNTTLGGQSWRECYGYDPRSRLTSAFTTTGDCAAGARGTGPQPYDHRYSYSVDGNLTQRTEGSATVGYTYPSGVRPHAPTRVGATTLSWNGHGALASRGTGGQAETFTWDAEHRLARVQGPGGDSRFVYDTDGQRLLRQEPGRTTFTFEGHEVSTTSGGVPAAVRTYLFNDESIATRTPAGVQYLVHDDQRSVQASVAAGGSPVVRTYLPYGKARQAARHATDRGWVGQVEDAATGLSYLNARYYDPGAGIFLSPDPVIDQERPKTVNPYAYAMGNPATLSDPTGLDPPCEHRGSTCSSEALAGQIQALAPSHSYEEVLNHVIETSGAVATPTDDHLDDLRIEGADDETMQEIQQGVQTTGQTADVSSLGLELCDSTGCARISQVVRGVGHAADVTGVVLECGDRDMDGPCALAIAVFVAKRLPIPVVAHVILAVELLSAVGLAEHYVDIIESSFADQPQNFGDELTWDREVVEEHGQPVYETGGPCTWCDGTGTLVDVGDTGQGGFGCPLRGCDELEHYNN